MAIQPLLQQAPEPATGAGDAPSGVDPEAAIGEQLRELRQVKNLTLREVADKAGISVSYLSQLERNQSRLPIGVLKKIADALGVHMNWFFQSPGRANAAESDIVVRAAQAPAHVVHRAGHLRGTAVAQPERAAGIAAEHDRCGRRQRRLFP